MSLRSLVLVVAVVVSAAPVAADTIHMKNGHRIDGHIVSEVDGSYVVETGSTTFTISTSMIERVVKYTHRDTSLVLLGDELASQQEYALARRYYERALEVTESPEVIYKRLKTLEQLMLRKDELTPIDQAFKQGQFRLAADLCQALVENRPDDTFTAEVRRKASKAYSQLAQQYYDSVRTEEAVFELRRAIELDPYNPDAHCLAGMILARQGHYRQAREELMLAQELDPGNALVAEGIRLLGETTGGAQELAKATATRGGLDTRELDELLGEAQFAGRIDGIEYAALARRTRPIEPVKFDMSAIARRGGSGANTATLTGGRPIYQFNSTRALSIFLQAYNAGPGAAAMYNGNVPYTETVNYVQRVAKAIEDISTGRIGATAYDPLIEKYALEYGFHPTLIKAIVKVESNFNPKCVSTADARGLIQLVKVDWVDTMKRLKREMDFDQYVFDPDLNLMVGCHYLRWLVEDCLPIYFEGEF